MNGQLQQDMKGMGDWDVRLKSSTLDNDIVEKKGNKKR